jgi:hypothetical protein
MFYAGPFAAKLPSALDSILNAYTSIIKQDGPEAAEAYIFHPVSGDVTRPIESSAWTQYVRRLFGKLAGTEIAPKTLRAIFITWIRETTDAPDVLKSAAHAMKHRPETQASGVYDANADTQLVKAAYDFNLAFAANFTGPAIASTSGASGGEVARVKHQAPKPQPPPPPPSTPKGPKEGEYVIDKVVDVRPTGKGGAWEMKVRWEGEDKEGKPWPDDWIPWGWASPAALKEARELKKSRGPMSPASKLKPTLQPPSFVSLSDAGPLPTLDEQAAAIAKNLAKERERAAQVFSSLEEFEQATGLTKGLASTNRNNCLYNAAAQAHGLLHPSLRSHKSVLQRTQEWRAELHASLLPRLHPTEKGATGAWDSNHSRETAEEIFTHNLFSAPINVHELASRLAKPIVVLQEAGRGTDQAQMVSAGKHLSVTYYSPDISPEAVLSKADAMEIQAKGDALWLHLSHGHFEPMLPMATSDATPPKMAEQVDKLVLPALQDVTLSALPRVGDVVRWRHEVVHGSTAGTESWMAKVLSVSLDEGGVMMQAFDDAGEELLKDEHGNAAAAFYVSLQTLVAGGARVVCSGTTSPIPSVAPTEPELGVRGDIPLSPKEYEPPEDRAPLEAGAPSSLATLAQNALGAQLVQQADDINEAAMGQVLPSVPEQHNMQEEGASAAEVEVERFSDSMDLYAADEALEEIPDEEHLRTPSHGKRAMPQSRRSTRHSKRPRKSFPPPQSTAKAAIARQSRPSLDNEQAFCVDGIAVGQELLALGLAPNGSREWFHAKVMALRPPPSWPPILVKVSPEKLQPSPLPTRRTHLELTRVYTHVSQERGLCNVTVSRH